MADHVDGRCYARRQQDKRHLSIFDVPSDFFDSCRLLPPHSRYSSTTPDSFDALTTATTAVEASGGDSEEGFPSKSGALSRWSCNTCKAEFESLQDQRSHFKSDIHRFNIKLSIAGKSTVTEDDFDVMISGSPCKEYDVSSISGSDDEVENRSCNDMHQGLLGTAKKKLFIRLHTGDTVSVWRCLFMDSFENIFYDIDRSVVVDEGQSGHLRENEVIGKLKYLIHEPRDSTRLRVVLLASGGHFAGCVFDGNLVAAHKTFHRYVVRAKAGKKQSSKDGTGKPTNSAGASLRRYNEHALRKEIQETLAAWKPYFDVSSCVFIYAPSSNRQLLFDEENPYFSSSHTAIRSIPFTVRRPTFKEARRIYSQLVQVSHEEDDKELQTNRKFSDACTVPSSDSSTNNTDMMDAMESSKNNKLNPPGDGGEIEMVCAATPLHEASKSGDSQKILEHLENGLDPCVKDERGRTPYMLATEKEVRNTFRRFMAANLDKWDWVAAKVPSALSKEMEDSQAAKQAEKDEKRKARSKELKKLRRAREKKAQAEAALSKSTAASPQDRKVGGPSVAHGGQTGISKEEELKRAQADEREKRAAAAERRMAAAMGTLGLGADIHCSYCRASLAGKVPFHRYDYKYCSTTCMDLHREILEAG